MLRYVITAVALVTFALLGATVGSALTRASIVASSPNNPSTSLASLIPPRSTVAVATVTQTVGATRTTVVTRTAVERATQTLIVLATDTPPPMTDTVTTTPQYADESDSATTVRAQGKGRNG